MSDPVRKPAHYLALGATCACCGAAIECKRVTRHMSFELGSAVKYIWRCDQKGDAIENLEKAIECITEEIAMRKEAAGTGRELATDEALHEIALGWWP